MTVLFPRGSTHDVKIAKNIFMGAVMDAVKLPDAKSKGNLENLLRSDNKLENSKFKNSRIKDPFVAGSFTNIEFSRCLVNLISSKTQETHSKIIQKL